MAKESSQAGEYAMQPLAFLGHGETAGCSCDEAVPEQPVEPQLHHLLGIVDRSEGGSLNRPAAEHDEHRRGNAAEHEREKEDVELAQQRVEQDCRNPRERRPDAGKGDCHQRDTQRHADQHEAAHRVELQRRAHRQSVQQDGKHEGGEREDDRQALAFAGFAGLDPAAQGMQQEGNPAPARRQRDAPVLS